MTEGPPPPPPPPPPPRGPGGPSRSGPSWGGPGGSPPPPGGGRPPDGASTLPENVASGLAYLATVVTGVIFLFIDRRLEVRFHSIQSILFGVVWLVIEVLRRSIDFFPVDFLLFLAWLVALGSWVVLLVQGFQGNHFKLPILGDLAEQQARNMS